MTTVSAGVALGQVVPFETVTTLSSEAVPVERKFDIPQAGAGQYRITVTDIGALLTVPGAAPLDSVHVLITRGTTAVATLDDTQDAASPVDTATFNATPGEYTVHIVGKPGPQPGSGAFNLRIENVASGAAILAFGETLSPPQATQEDVRTYQAEIEIPATGSYELTLADLGFPRALQTSGAFVFQDGASSLTTCLSVPADPNNVCVPSRTINLAAGRYQVVAAGALATGSDGGVFSVHFRAVADGAVVHSRTVELGRVRRVSPLSFQLDAGAHTLNLKDLEFPLQLTSNSVILTRAAQVIATADPAHPDVVFTVPGVSTAYDVFAYALPDGTAGAGSYNIEVRSGSGAALLSSIEAVGNSSGSTVAYTFPGNVTTAGNYRARLGDFRFPVALSAARLAVVQNGVVLAKTADGDPGPTLSLDVPNLATGSVTAIAIARPAILGGSVLESGGTFGIELASNPGDQIVLDATQGVGGLVSVRKVSILQAGRYDLALSDLDFPAVFRDLMAVISRGSQRLGVVQVGSGPSNPQGGSATLADFEATAGNYSVTVIAQAGAANAATYALSFIQAPPGPTVTLEANPTTVVSGNTTKLTWSSQSATSCIASSSPTGAWSGTKALSSSAGENSAALTAATTFTLKCTGAGDRTSEKSVTVSVAAQSTGSGGGGGSFGWFGLLGLAACRALARARGARCLRPAH